ncbi:MAG: nitroreductase [Haliscomenobacteraceae bacterium CHB4]|nr:hypothetical protein [Saprospiraceae bacterium]MCE7924834.1 nitroreductase [Haliscomenobacteraceae bacterium CHB4]
MNRATFLKIAGGTLLAAGGAGYLLSDRKNFVRTDIRAVATKFPLLPDEREILYMASLAPSGHNTQPWFVKYLEPYHWIIGNDRSKWLPAVDPTQRETLLSIGAFVQNLELAANTLGYSCAFELLAQTNQDENVVSVRLKKTGSAPRFDLNEIKLRRTVRSHFSDIPLRKADLDFLLENERDCFVFFEKNSPEHKLLNEQTIEANQTQADRNDAQTELSEWMRFSSRDAEKYCDGLTVASMEIEGVAGWFVRNFYKKSNVTAPGFRKQGVDIVKKQVAQSGGWMLIASKGNTVATLLETGRRMQRLFLKIRQKNIALHPMTQILEEPPFNQNIAPSLGVTGNIQFILRMGYLDKYPAPVSLRRPVEWFVR